MISAYPRRTILVVLCVLSARQLQAQAPNCATGLPEPPAGHSVFLEEDNFQSHPHTDRNYTMGLGFSASGGGVTRRRLDIGLKFFDRGTNAILRGLLSPRAELPGFSSCDVQLTTATLAGTAFTPLKINSADIIRGDRPYSFLLGVTVRRQRIDTIKSSSWYSEATIGTIGSPVGKFVQTQIHWAFRAVTKDSTPFAPRGWDHQILDSRLGVPTFRYAIGNERSIAPLSFSLRNKKTLEMTWTGAGEIGYYTSFSSGIQARLGRFTTPFWQITSDPLAGGNRGPNARPNPRFEWFIWGRGAGRAVAYNALLQGYGSWMSDYVLSSRQTNHFISESAYGATGVFRWNDGESSTTVTWVRDAMRTSELNTSFGRRHYWGSIFVSWSP